MNAIPCMASRDLNRHLAEWDQEEAMDLAIEQRLADMTAAGGTPFVALIEQMPTSLQRQINDALSKIIEGRDFYKASTQLRAAYEKYLTALIRDDAAEAALDAALQQPME